MTTAPLPGMPPAAVPGRRGPFASVQLRTWLVYVPLCVVSSAMAVATWDHRSGGATSTATGSQLSGTAILLWLLAIALTCGLAYRRRFPVVVAVVLAAATLVLPMDPVAALIAFGSLTVRRFDRVTVGVGALVWVATIVSTFRDTRSTSKDSSFWQMLRADSQTGSEPAATYAPFSWWIVLVISTVLVAVAFGIAMIIRDRQQSRARQVVDAEQRVVVDSLSDELAMQAERERIAREVHDALGHRLSLLSLHAGALEMTVGDDDRARESAAVIRANAQQSMTDLRNLVAQVRHPSDPDVAAAVPTLGDLAALVDETTSTGVTLVSSIQLESIERLDAQTSRSAYRLTQEMLTNARRHAPGIGIRASVRATPATGVAIEVANHLPTGADGVIRPGSGLTGAQTRVTQLGGQWWCWIDEHRVFRVAAHLPWVWSSDQPGSPTPPPPSPTHVGHDPGAVR